MGSAHRLVVLWEGRLITQGASRDILTPGLIAEVFGVRAWNVWDTEVGRLLCLPLGKSARPPDGSGLYTEASRSG